MTSFLRRFQSSKSSKTFRESGREDTSTAMQVRDSHPSRKNVQTSSYPAFQSVNECSLKKSRKRDRVRNYLVRRRESKDTRAQPYSCPAILSSEKEDVRASDDTEIIDDVYMVDFHHSSDSDEDSPFEHVYVAPPVSVPDTYRRQDRLGGITVAGVRILFTYAGFKRRQMLIHKLETISESNELVIPTGWNRETIVIGNVVYW